MSTTFAKSNFRPGYFMSFCIGKFPEFSSVDLSDCLIAGAAQKTGAFTLYTFENERKLGALPIVTRLKKDINH